MGVENPKVKPPKKSAAGVPAVMHALEYSLEQTSLVRTAINLLNINQTNGIDCPGCAWPEPEPGSGTRTSTARTAPNTSTTRRPRAGSRQSSSASTPSPSWRRSPTCWLNQQGRLTEPMVKRPGSDHYEPISWDDALDLIAAELRALDSPDEALFYTSGRAQQRGGVPATSCSRAAFGTNNLPDCSQHVPRVQRCRR